MRAGVGVAHVGVADEHGAEQAAEGQDDDADEDAELDGQRTVGEPAGSPRRARGGGVEFTGTVLGDVAHVPDAVTRECADSSDAESLPRPSVDET